MDASASSLLQTLPHNPTEPIQIFLPSNNFDWLNPLIAGLSALGGVLLAEVFRRKNRETLYIDDLFKKRFKIYEELYSLMNQAHSESYNFIYDKNLNKKDRKDKLRKLRTPITEFLNKYELYIHEDLAIHCLLFFKGVEKIPDLDITSRIQALTEFESRHIKTQELIKEDSGLKRLEKVLKGINKPRIKIDLKDINQRLNEDIKD